MYGLRGVINAVAQKQQIDHEKQKAELEAQKAKARAGGR